MTFGDSNVSDSLKEFT